MARIHRSSLAFALLALAACGSSPAAPTDAATLQGKTAQQIEDAANAAIASSYVALQGDQTVHGAKSFDALQSASLTTGAVTASGALSALSLSAGSLAATGAVTAASLSADTLTATGAISGASVSATTLSATGAAAVGSLDVASGALHANASQVTVEAALNVRDNALLVTNEGPVGIGTAQPLYSLDITGDLHATSRVVFGADATVGGTLSAGDINSHGYPLTRSYDMRGVVSKSTADSFCGGQPAAFVPWSYRGKSGDQICQDTGATCTKVTFIVVAVNGQTPTANPLPPPPTGYARTCSDGIDSPWPWGLERNGHVSLSGGDLGHGDTWIVCCMPPEP